MLGKPVLLASRALYEYGSQHFDGALQGIIAWNAGEMPRTLPLTERFSVKRFGLAYYYMFAFELAVSCSDRLRHIRGQVELYQLAKISPPEQMILWISICGYLLNGRPLFDCPGVEERSRTTADEDAFFEELSALARLPEKCPL